MPRQRMKRSPPYEYAAQRTASLTAALAASALREEALRKALSQIAAVPHMDADSDFTKIIAMSLIAEKALRGEPV